jgi:hypothetical protein
MIARVCCAATLFVLFFLITGQAQAQDKGPGETELKPDLPLERAAPEAAQDPPPTQDTAPTPQGEKTDPPPVQPPPQEEAPGTPTPEFFDEPMETAEVIFVIDRTGSMRWPSKMSVVDEGGNPVNNAAKCDVARIELVKAINNLADNMKFAMVCFATASHYVWGTTDMNWNGAGWTAWPPASGEPAPFGWHSTDASSLPVWPTNGALVEATGANKSAAVAWAQQRLPSPAADPYVEVKGGTCTHDGMSVALKMVTPPPPGKGPGGEPKKSATGIYLLTDGAPTHLGGTAYGLCIVITSYDSGGVENDGTWEAGCMNLTKSKILAENVYRAKIFTLGMGMDMSCPNAKVWNPSKGAFDFFPTEYNNLCRKFLTELAEATGGHYREVSR